MTSSRAGGAVRADQRGEALSGPAAAICPRKPRLPGQHARDGDGSRIIEFAVESLVMTRGVKEGLDDTSVRRDGASRLTSTSSASPSLQQEFAGHDGLGAPALGHGIEHAVDGLNATSSISMLDRTTASMTNIDSTTRRTDDDEPSLRQLDRVASRGGADRRGAVQDAAGVGRASARGGCRPREGGAALARADSQHVASGPARPAPLARPPPAMRRGASPRRRGGVARPRVGALGGVRRRPPTLLRPPRRTRASAGRSPSSRRRWSGNSRRAKEDVPQWRDAARSSRVSGGSDASPSGERLPDPSSSAARPEPPSAPSSNSSARRTAETSADHPRRRPMPPNWSTPPATTDASRGGRPLRTAAPPRPPTPSRGLTTPRRAPARPTRRERLRVLSCRGVGVRRPRRPARAFAPAVSSATTGDDFTWASVGRRFELSRIRRARCVRCSGLRPRRRPPARFDDAVDRVVFRRVQAVLRRAKVFDSGCSTGEHRPRSDASSDAARVLDGDVEDVLGGRMTRISGIRQPPTRRGMDDLPLPVVRLCSYATRCGGRARAHHRHRRASTSGSDRLGSRSRAT